MSFHSIKILKHGSVTMKALVRRSFLRIIPLLVVISSVSGHSQTAQNFIPSLVGQKLILRYFGEKEKASLRKEDLSRLKGTCDVAVQVRAARWMRDKVQLQWELIGTPSVPGQPRGVCSNTMIIDAGRIEISGFDKDESVDSLVASLSAILQSPEQYLAAKGIQFNLKPGADNENAGPAPKEPYDKPKTLLAIDPTFSEDARRAKLQGVVVVAINVGSDGRIHSPRIVRNPGYGLDEMALKVLPLWRYEPARKLDKAIPLAMNIEMNFQLY